MRAGRLLSLLLVLQNGGRFTARDLAQRLAVSERTVLRDIDTLSQSGVPVYGVRGPGGGFTMLDTFEQRAPPLPPGLAPGTGRLRRVRVRLAPAALQLALGSEVEVLLPDDLRQTMASIGQHIARLHHTKNDAPQDTIRSPPI